MTRFRGMAATSPPPARHQPATNPLPIRYQSATNPLPIRYQHWYLQPGSGLAKAPPPDSEPDHYRYDPADPTPAVGGNSLGATMGPKDNRALEARPDVLVYTSAILECDLEVIGPVTASLYVRSSLQYTDFFAKLCVVEESGKSVNLCDGILRLTPGSVIPESDGSLHFAIEVWPTASHFRKGQRLRVQISSGAHSLLHAMRVAANPWPLERGSALPTRPSITIQHIPRLSCCRR
jgi:putative CocE/NonD family hydrolase